MKYGWPASRILDSYTQHVNAVHKVMPKGLQRPGVDEINKPKQCYDFVMESPRYKHRLVRKALGDPDMLTNMQLCAFLDWSEAFCEWLRENPWEPHDLDDEANSQVQFDSLSLITIQTGVPEVTLRRWISQGMPCRVSGHKKATYVVQLCVVQYWMIMKNRHKIRKHLTRRNNGR